MTPVCKSARTLVVPPGVNERRREALLDPEAVLEDDAEEALPLPPAWPFGDGGCNREDAEFADEECSSGERACPSSANARALPATKGKKS
jgi:hypothetical protein